MSWSRSLVAAALADVLKAAQGPEDNASVFASPPETLNTPAIVVGRPIEVLYGVGAFAVDTATLPVVCIGPFLTGEDVVDALITFVRQTIGPATSLNGAVRSCTVTREANWRAMRVAGADLLGADVVLTVET
jgi:hypothetical protein